MIKNTKIDFTVWVTQQVLADELKVNVQNVHNWTKRGKIQSQWYEFLPNQKILLVNKETISVNNQHYKRRDKK